MEKFIEKPRHIEVQILGEWGVPGAAARGSGALGFLGFGKAAGALPPQGPSPGRWAVGAGLVRPEASVCCFEPPLSHPWEQR